MSRPVQLSALPTEQEQTEARGYLRSIGALSGPVNGPRWRPNRLRAPSEADLAGRVCDGRNHPPEAIVLDRTVDPKGVEVCTWCR